MRKFIACVMLAVFLMSVCAGYAGAEKTKIVWAIGSTTRQPMYNTIAKQYMDKNPDVEIMTIVPGSPYYDTLLTWIVSGVQVDLMWLGQALLSFGDVLLPLDDLVAKDKNVAAIHPSILNIARWEGKQIGLPFGVNTNVVFYNKQMFDTAGVAYPKDSWRYQDMVSIGAKITKDTSGDGKPDVWGVPPLIYDHAFSQGGDFYSADNRKAQFANPVSIETTQFIADLNNGKYGVCYPQVPSSQRDPMFYNERVAMYPGGAFFTPIVRKNVKFDWDIVAYPGMEIDGKRYDSTFVSLETLAISKESKNVAATKDFLAYLFTAEGMKPIVDMATVIPSQPKQWPNYMTQPTPPNNLLAFMKSVDYVHKFHFDHPVGTYVITNVLNTKNSLYNNMIKGAIPAALAMPELEKQVNAYLDEYWAKRDAGK